MLNSISRGKMGGHKSGRVAGSLKIAGAPVQTVMSVSITLDAWIGHARPIFRAPLQTSSVVFTQVCQF